MYEEHYNLFMNSLPSPSDTPFFGSAQFRGASSSKRNSGTVLQQEEEEDQTFSKEKRVKLTDPKISKAVASVWPPFRWIFPEVLKAKLGKDFYDPYHLQLKAGSKVRILSGKVVLGEKIDDDLTIQTIYFRSCLILEKIARIESSNFPSRTRKSFNPNTIATAEMESIKIDEKLKNLRASCSFQEVWNSEMQTYADKILETNCGNCRELAIAFIAFFRKLDLNLWIEYCSYDQGNHAIVIINRNPDDFSKIVIVDPWSRSIYTYKEEKLPSTLITSLCYMNSDKKAVACPIVEPYDIRKGITLFRFEKEHQKPCN